MNSCQSDGYGTILYTIMHMWVCVWERNWVKVCVPACTDIYTCIYSFVIFSVLIIDRNWFWNQHFYKISALIWWQKYNESNFLKLFSRQSVTNCVSLTSVFQSTYIGIYPSWKNEQILLHLMKSFSHWYANSLFFISIHELHAFLYVSSVKQCIELQIYSR